MNPTTHGASPERSPNGSTPLDDQLESVREYLTWVAGQSIEPSLTAKLGASDLVQDTFLEARRLAPSYRGHCIAQLRAWLETILRHRISRERRRFLKAAKRNARLEIGLAAGSGDGSASGPLAIADPAAKGGTASAQYMQRELIDALVAAIDRLPEHYRQVVRLRHEMGLSFEQIAVQLGVSPDAARKLWARALVRLRDALRPGHDPG